MLFDGVADSLHKIITTDAAAIRRVERGVVGAKPYEDEPERFVTSGKVPMAAHL